MSHPAIRVENLGKEYQLGLREKSDRNFRELLMDLAAMPMKRFRYLSGKDEGAERIWALRDVSFDVQPGEVVGIIGRNGAGKSTLLKILTRITEPTVGRAEVRGHVGSLLEVGTGFHPELTGRENIFLNGAILGMPRVKIKQKFDEIVDFSGVERFIDTPVKRYSSGMRVRLAFAVAAYLEPEILLIDEVLAVGDVEFQKKCLGKMDDVAQKGRTVLFVSHNMGAVKSLCSRCFVIKQGAIDFTGTAHQAVDHYLQGTSDIDDRRVEYEDDPKKQICIREIAVKCPDKQEFEPLDIADQIEMHVTYRVRQDISGSNLAITLTREGTVVFRSFDIDLNRNAFELREAGLYRAKITLPRKLFVAGRFSIGVGTGRPSIGTIDRRQEAISFKLGETSENMTHVSYSKSRGGILIMPLPWETTRISHL